MHFLHSEQFFAAAQKKYVYIYDKRGLEVHCLKVRGAARRGAQQAAQQGEAGGWCAAGSAAAGVGAAGLWLEHGRGGTPTLGCTSVRRSSARRAARTQEHTDVRRLDFLPHHFLLTSVGTAGVLRYQDTSTGAIVAQHRTKLGPCSVMAQNPWNAVMVLGHGNGTVRCGQRCGKAARRRGLHGLAQASSLPAPQPAVEDAERGARALLRAPLPPVLRLPTPSPAPAGLISQHVDAQHHNACGAHALPPRPAARAGGRRARPPPRHCWR